MRENTVLKYLTYEKNREIQLSTSPPKINAKNDLETSFEKNINWINLHKTNFPNRVKQSPPNHWGAEQQKNGKHNCSGNRTEY